MVEMIAATALVAGVVVPTTAVLRDAMQQSREAVRRQFLANYAVRTLEDQASFAMRNWAAATVAGSFAAEGHPRVRYVVDRSDSPADGGIAGRLMNIQVTVYDDDDGDSALDAAELQVTFRTKVAKLKTYEHAPL